jgi:D-serine deaminase-like pyridoxal phosphate-dependent protein
VKLRPDVETHRCPVIAHRQLAAGGTVGGIMVSNLGQAEVFAQHGFTDIAVAMPIVAKQKIDRVKGLARFVKITVSVDSEQNVRDLGGAGVNVRLETPWGKSPELKDLVAKTTGLTLAPPEAVAGDYVLSGKAARVLATVISRPEPGLALLDLGQKAITADTGWPLVDLPGARIAKQSAEHGFLILDGAKVGIGDKVWAVPHDIGNCANVYDFINVVSNGRLEAIWPIAARGHYR